MTEINTPSGSAPGSSLSPLTEAEHTASDTSTYTRCTSYREACDLAGSRRYAGTDAFAVFSVVLDC